MMVQMEDVRTKYGLPSTDEMLARLDAGETLPAPFYYAPEIHRLEQEKIFAKSWQYACHESAVAKPGDYAVTRAGSVPIIVTHGKDGQLRGFVNVSAPPARDRGGERQQAAPAVPVPRMDLRPRRPAQDATPLEA